MLSIKIFSKIYVFNLEWPQPSTAFQKPTRSFSTILKCSLLLGLVLTACKKSNRDPIPNVSNIQTNTQWIRFELELAALDTNQLETSLQALMQRYPVFSKLYFEQILAITESSDTIQPEFLNALRAYRSDPFYQDILEKTKKVFNSTPEIKKQMETSVKFMKYYFPNDREPVFYSLLSNFSYANFVFADQDSITGIGIGLEFFLGDEMNYKSLDPKNPVFSEYLTRCFNKDHLLKKSWEAYLSDKLPEPESGQLIDYLIHRGKKLYLLEKILPEIEDTVLFEFTPAQLQWCNHNRLEIWSYFLSGNMLYSTELMKFNKFINPSPSSPGMPKEAPGQTGSYIGYHLIKAYMQKHSKMTMDELISQKDAQLILRESRFKPVNN